MGLVEHQFRSHCPINFAQEVFGDRWCLLIIRDLVFKGKKHYGEFLESSEQISTNILANRLKKLQKMELITKTTDTSNQSKYVYELTPKGIDLIPMLIEMIIWGATHDNNTDAPDELVKRCKTDKEGLMYELIENLGK